MAVFNPKDKEEPALTLGGKKSNFRLAHFQQFAVGLGLTQKQVQNSYTSFRRSKEKAFNWLDNSFLSHDLAKDNKNLMESRYTIINLP